MRLFNSFSGGRLVAAVTFCGIAALLPQSAAAQLGPPLGANDEKCQIGARRSKDNVHEIEITNNTESNITGATINADFGSNSGKEATIPKINIEVDKEIIIYSSCNYIPRITIRSDKFTFVCNNISLLNGGSISLGRCKKM
jgi:hypothetical protein